MGLIGFAARQAFYAASRNSRQQQRPAPRPVMYAARPVARVRLGAKGWAQLVLVLLVAALPFALVLGVCVHVYHDRQAGDRAWQQQVQQQSVAPLPSFGSAP